MPERKEAQSEATEPLAYCTPATFQRVQRELAKAELISWSSVAVKLGIGIPLCLLGPLLITAILKAIEGKWRASVFPKFGAMLSIVSLVLVPLLFWLDRRTNGAFFSEAHAGEPNLGRPTSRGEWELRHTEALWRGYTEIALTGPKLVREAIAHLRGHPRTDQSVRLLAAEVAAALYDAGEGVAIKSLLHPDRPPKALLGAICHLERLEWVGLSVERDRIWLSSRSRDRLRHAG